MRPGWLVAVALSCVLLSACADQRDAQRPITIAHVGEKSAAALAVAAPCPPTTVQSPTRSSLRNFAPVEAVWCQESEQDYPGDGQWSVMIKKRTAHNLSGLLAAFLQSDDRTSHGGCAAILIVGPLVELVNAAGKYVVPAYPRDGCGQPKHAIISLVESDVWQLVSTTKEHQLVNQAALSAGCSMQWKNELSFMASAPLLPRAATLFARAGDRLSLRVCLYRSPASDRTVGNFIGTRHLDATETAQLRGALSGPGQPQRCDLQQSFAVIQQSGGAWVNVEVGGCWRVVRDDLDPLPIGHADPTTTGKLLG